MTIDFSYQRVYQLPDETEEITEGTLGAMLYDFRYDSIEVAQNRVDRLWRMIQTEQNRTRAARTLHQEDIAKIGQRLTDEAQDREWCSIYDDVVDEINRNLHIKLPTRTRQYNISVTYKYTVSVLTDARDDEEARRFSDQLFGAINEAQVMVTKGQLADGRDFAGSWEYDDHSHELADGR